jgi:hypothetical protein
MPSPKCGFLRLAVCVLRHFGQPAMWTGRPTGGWGRRVLGARQAGLQALVDAVLARQA